jgi:hypothetical protein
MRGIHFELYTKLNAVEEKVTRFEAWTTFASAGLLTTTMTAYVVMM